MDGARSAASKCYSSCVGSESNKGGEAPANVEAGALKELARTRRRNADKVDPGIGRTRLGHRTLKCALTIGTRSAQSIMASGFTAAQTGRTHDRTRPMLQLRQKVLAKAPSTHDPTRTFVGDIRAVARSGSFHVRRTLYQHVKEREMYVRGVTARFQRGSAGKVHIYAVVR